MKTRISDISNYFGTVLLIALFLLIVVFISGGLNQQSVLAVSNETVTEWHSVSTLAVRSDAAQLPLFQLNWVSVVDKMHIQFFNPTFKQSSDSRKITQRFLCLCQTELVIKPLSRCCFYYHLFPKGSDIEPILS